MDLEHLAVAHMDLGLVVHGPGTEILYANPAATRYLSLERDAILQRIAASGVWDVITPEGTPLAGSELPSSIAGATREPVRARIIGVGRPRTSDRVWLAVDSIPVLHHDNSLRCVVTTFRPVAEADVSDSELTGTKAALSTAVTSRTADLAEALRRLKESETSHLSTIMAMAEGVAVHGRDGVILQANPAAEEILGLTVAQMQGTHPVGDIWELTRADGSPLPAEEIPSEITRATGEPCRNRILRVRRGTGDIAWLSVNTAPMIFDGETAPYTVVATFTDITQERTALRSAEESRDRLTRLTQAIPGVIIEMEITDDGEERISFASTRAAEIMGIPAEALVADPSRLWNVVEVPERQLLLDARQAAVESGKPIDVDVPIRVDDESRWLRFRSARPVRDESSWHVNLIVLDITDHHRVTQALYQTQRREGLGVLAAGIAHNFNNMLAAIIPSIESALDEPNQPSGPALRDALQAARGATELVRQIMLLAGQGGGSEPAPVDMTRVAREVIKMARRTFTESVAIELKVDGVQHEPLVMGTATMLQQVLLNLVVNARDATTDQPDPRISITVQTSEDTVAVLVGDNGTGMSEAVKSRVGEPFFTTKDQGEGTGLGLASAMGIAADLDGSLKVDSTLGEGSLFTFTLPRATASGPLPETAPAADGHAPPPGGVALIVDDEALVRSAISRLLKRAGMTVATAESGGAAVDWLATNPEPAVIFLDMSMPGLSGTETLARIRAKHGDLPVVLMSGFLPDEETTRGADAVMQKPMRAREITALLAKLIPTETR